MEANTKEGLGTHYLKFMQTGLEHVNEANIYEYIEISLSLSLQ